MFCFLEIRQDRELPEDGKGDGSEGKRRLAYLQHVFVGVEL